MLILNLKAIFADKGIENPSLFLRKCGLTTYTASRLLNNKVDSIYFKHLETICLGLKCSIDDLFLWLPDDETTNIENQPLQKLKPKVNDISLSQKLKELPFDKIEAIKNFIDKINSNNPQQ